MNERKFRATIDALRAAGDEPLPRHFFVSGETSALPLPRRLAWPLAALAASLIVVALAAALLLQPHVRAERGVVMLALGDDPLERVLEPLEGRILQSARAAARRDDEAWLAQLREELRRADARAASEGSKELASALEEIETRLDESMARSAERWRSETDRAVVAMYGALDARRRSDMAYVRDRIEQMTLNDEARGRENSLILAALYPPAGSLED